MPTNSANCFPDCSTLANFEAWAQFISNFFATAGWVQQGDTGQVNWSTISAVPGSGAPVFEIWKSQDSLSAVCPITVKIQYGSYSGPPQIGITVGTNGTDGAGNLNAPVSTNLLLNAYSAQASGTWPCFASGDAGSIRFMMFTPNGATGYPNTYEYVFFSIGRSRDNSGNVSASYVLLHAAEISYNYTQAIFPASVGGVTPIEYQYFLTALPYRSTGAYAGNTAVGPAFAIVGGLSNPSPDLLLGKAADFVDGSGASVSMYGTAHNYIVLNPNASLTTYGNGAILMRYE